jgi:rubrerythrin
MQYDFNANEILQMAEQLERNGADFYRKSMEKVQNTAGKELLLSLAEMEDQHEKTFATLRSKLTANEKAQTVFDPGGDTVRYLKALADSKVFFEKTIDTDNLEGILKEAITAEKDSILFYLGLKDVVPEALGKDRIDEVIKEEMSHINLLTRELVALKKG